MDSHTGQKTTDMKGRLLYVDSQLMWLACGRELLYSQDGGTNWQFRARLPVSRLREWLVSLRLGRRLGRVGFHHFVPTGKDAALIVAHQHVFELVPGQQALERIGPLVGSRPLVVCQSGGVVYYGEYRSNPERTPIHVFARSKSDEQWRVAWTFEQVRHVHGVFADPYTGALWVTTGDTDNESALWLTDDAFNTLERIVGGSQRYRAVRLLFTAEYVYFASDAPDEQNFIYRLHRKSLETEKLQAVAGPVFYGCKMGEWLFFSTVVEPSQVNTSQYAEVWGSRDGTTWQRVARHKKDWLSMKYFQYGQVLFPAGPGGGHNLWYTPMATTNDQKTLRISLPNEPS